MHNFSKHYKYVTIETKLNEKQIKELLHLAIDNDVKINDEIFGKLVNPGYPFITYHNDRISQASHYDSDDLVVSFEEFKAFIQGKGKYKVPFNESLELSSDYTAVVTKNHVKVGCQTFTHQKIKELYNLSVKAQKSKV